MKELKKKTLLNLTNKNKIAGKKKPCRSQVEYEFETKVEKTYRPAHKINLFVGKPKEDEHL